MTGFHSDMCSEFRRYATFNGFDTPSGVWPSQLAQAGFCRTGTCVDHQVTCFACGLQVDVRHLAGGQPVMEVHRRLSPVCSFVTGAANNQSVPAPNSLLDSGSNATLELETMIQNFSAGGRLQGNDLYQNYSHPPARSSFPLVPDNNNSNSSITAGGGRSLPPSLLPFFPDGVTPLPHLPGFSSLEESQPHPAPGVAPIPTPSLPSIPMDVLEGLANATLDSLSPPATYGEIPYGLGSTNQLFNSFLNGGGAAGGVQENLATDGVSLGVQGHYPEPGMVQSQINDFVAQATTTPALPQNSEDVSSSNVPVQKLTFSDLGIVVERPKRQDMAMYGKRLETFDRWVGQQISQSKECIAEAGFYYAGYADCCRCFYCGGGLKSWDKDDDPWVEHARWFKTCPYVKTSKGKGFIDAVQSLNRNDNAISMAEVEEEMKRIGISYTSPNDVPSVVSDTHPDVEMDLQATDEDSEATMVELENENESLQRPECCKICLDNVVSVLYLPCGHLVTCSSCSPTVKKCPVCRDIITGRVRVQR